MTSLQQYRKQELVSRLLSLASKSALVLDAPDLEAVVERAVGLLDSRLYLPRSVLFDRQFVVTEKGGTFVDVTAFDVDVVCRVYFSNTGSDVSSGVDTLGVGLLPWLSSQGGVSFLQDVTGWLVLQGNLNMINRHMGTVDDYELWPVGADGRRLLQIRHNPALFILEYLPWLDPKKDGWYLFQSEYEFLLEWSRCEMYLRNLEAVMSAQVLGFAVDKISSQQQYWADKQKSLLEKFDESKAVAWL